MNLKPKTFLVAFVSAVFLQFATGLALAWYNPQTGRWLSRDPVGEPGFQALQAPSGAVGITVPGSVPLPPGRWFDRGPVGAGEEAQLYAFNGNDGVNSVDELGLMTVQDINNIIRQREANAAKTPCSCDCKPDNVWFGIMGASRSATTVYGFVPLSQALGQPPCTLDPQIYWWDCYSASAEGGWSSNWSDYGWSAGDLSYPKTAQPSMFSTRDPYHLAMVALYIYDSCDHGKRTVNRITSNRLQWTWDKKTKQWTGPASF
jgi:hypothetical protein